MPSGFGAKAGMMPNPAGRRSNPGRECPVGQPFRETDINQTINLSAAGRRATRPGTNPAYASRNGIPNALISSRDSSSLRPLMQMVMSIPCVKFTLSGSISGNTSCSDRPML